MAESKKRKHPDGEALPISEADDGGDSRLTKGYKDNPDKPDPSSIAQIEELTDEAPVRE